MKGLNKALFLDLIGTIIKTKSGKPFPEDTNDWEFISGVLPSIKRFSDQGYIVCIISNEGGIELGHTTKQLVEARLHSIRVEVEDYIRTDVNIAYCPSMDGYDRKPNPGMAYYFAIQLQLNLKQSIMIGDNQSDNEFALLSGMGAYLHINQFVDQPIPQ